MKKYILYTFIIWELLVFGNFVFAFDNYESVNNSHAVELDLTHNDEESDELFVESNLDNNYLNYDKSKDLKQQAHDILLHQDVNHIKPEEKKVSKTLNKKVGKNAQIGASYNTTTSSGEYDDSVSVFTKYEKGKTGITSSYTQSRKSYNSGEQGSLSVAPELNLNNHITLKNVYSDDLSTNTKKNELVFSVKPFKDERTDINLGAGQVYSESNQPARSQLNFSTNFRF